MGLLSPEKKQGHVKTLPDLFPSIQSIPWWAVGASLIRLNLLAEQFIECLVLALRTWIWRYQPTKGMLPRNTFSSKPIFSYLLYMKKRYLFKQSGLLP